jgi:hypothetical protein
VLELLNVVIVSLTISVVSEIVTFRKKMKVMPESKNKVDNPEQIQLLQNAYANFNARNIDAVLSLMKPDVIWPNGMEGGYVFGHDGVRAYWTRQWSMINPQVKPVSFERDENGNVIVHVHQIVRDLNGNLLLDQMVQHVYTIEDGLIGKMEIEKQ